MTDQPKWTPGPWVVEPVNHDGDGGTLVRLTDYPNPNCVANVWGTESAREPNAESIANAHLIAAAPDLYFGGEAQTDIIHHAQAILTQYLIPDGIDGPEAINQLLGLLDGPEQRAAQAAWDAALAKARGQA